MANKRTITIVIDDAVLERYDAYYFAIHTRAKKRPIPHPYHESINQWMILRRQAMNALKQRWKDFIIWLVNDLGYAERNIQRCTIKQSVWYQTNRRHDTDNCVPKFILDGLVEGGMIVDDDCTHIEELTLRCGVDKERPRTELKINIIN